MENNNIKKCNCTHNECVKSRVENHGKWCKNHNSIVDPKYFRG